jgi:hypothetical protein
MKPFCLMLYDGFISCALFGRLLTEQKQVIGSLVREVVVCEDSLDVKTRADGFQAIANTECSDAGDIQLSIPMVMKRRGGQKQIVLPSYSSETARQLPHKHNAFTIALTRAHCWQSLLDSGAYRSIKEMSQKLGVCSAYMARIMRLTLLAPDIVEAIVYGREPSGLLLNKFVKAIPKDWREQRILYGFTEKPGL